MKQIIFTTILALVFSTSAFAQNTNSLCAKIEVIGGNMVNAGEPMSFSAKVTGTTKNSTLEYEWKVSSGIISSGQGTSSIMVDTTGLAGTNITAEVKIKGLYDNCANTASEVSSVDRGLVCDRPFDEYGKLPINEVKARIQNLYVELGNSLNYQGYIINYGTDEEIANREKQIQKAINFLKFDANRLTIVRGGENPYEAGVLTRAWIVPPGAKFPQP